MLDPIRIFWPTTCTLQKRIDSASHKYPNAILYMVVDVYLQLNKDDPFEMGFRPNGDPRMLFNLKN